MKKTKWTRRWMYGGDKKNCDDDMVSRYTSQYGEIIEVDNYGGTKSYAVDSRDTKERPCTACGVIASMSGSNRYTKWFHTLKQAKEYVESKREV